MSLCPGCGTENPQGSKFCAKCGQAIPPPAPAGPPKCASCGAESPAGSRFCKECGKPVGGPAPQPPPTYPTSPPPPQSPLQRMTTALGAGAPARGGALSENLSKVKMLLWVCAGLFAVGAYLNYSTLSQLRAFYGQLAQYAGGQNTGFLLILCAVMGGLSAFAATQLARGNVKLAKGVLVADAVIGIIAFVLFLKGGIISIVLNGGIAACGIWGRMLIAREERPLI